MKSRIDRTMHRWALALTPILLAGCAATPDPATSSPDPTAQCTGSTVPANAQELPYAVAQKVAGGTTLTCLVEGGQARLSTMPGEGTSDERAEAIATDRPLPDGCIVQTEVQAFVRVDEVWYRARNAVCSGTSTT